MSWLLILLITLNIITLISFIVGFVSTYYPNLEPQYKANIGLVMGISMTLYLAVLIAFIVTNLFIQNFFILIFSIFVILPFLIGKFSRYNTMKKYSLLQIFCFTASLIWLLFL